MPHGQLNCPGIDPVAHAVGGIPVPKLMRKHRDAEFAPGISDGPLDMSLVHPIADFFMSAGVKAGVVSRKEPSPCPDELVFGIFGGQLVGQGDGDFILPIPQPDGLGEFHLLDEFRHQYFWEGNDTIFAAFGRDQKKREIIEIEVFDA